MAENEVLMTQESMRAMEIELEELKTTRRKEVAARIKQAIEFGDISENSEYDDAKNEQAFIEGRILSFEKMLQNARVIEADDVSVDVVSEYAYVTVLNLDSGEPTSFQIVGSVEAKPLQQKISNESPIGKALLGHKIGAELDIPVPSGTTRLRIMDIHK